MNKKQLVAAMHQHTDLSLAATERALNEILQAVSAELANGGAVTLIGFGGFSVRRRPARSGVDPRTGSTIEIEAKNIPKFTAGSTLKSVVNHKK